jgi:hypothetical protein
VVLGGLDDAIGAARSKASAWENMARSKEERERQERAEAQALLAEAVGRIRPFGTETFIQVKPVTFFGDYTGPGGQRYRQVSQQRCWKIARMSGRREIDGELGDEWMESPILLLEDGTAGRCWLDLGLRPERGKGVRVVDRPGPARRTLLH